jgi:hypothetical protein
VAGPGCMADGGSQRGIAGVIAGAPRPSLSVVAGSVETGGPLGVRMGLSLGRAGGWSGRSRFTPFGGGLDHWMAASRGVCLSRGSAGVATAIRYSRFSGWDCVSCARAGARAHGCANVCRQAVLRASTQDSATVVRLRPSSPGGRLRMENGHCPGRSAHFYPDGVVALPGALRTPETGWRRTLPCSLSRLSSTPSGRSPAPRGQAGAALFSLVQGLAPGSAVPVVSLCEGFLGSQYDQESRRTVRLELPSTAA